MPTPSSLDSEPEASSKGSSIPSFESPPLWYCASAEAYYRLRQSPYWMTGGCWGLGDRRWWRRAENLPSYIGLSESLAPSCEHRQIQESVLRTSTST